MKKYYFPTSSENFERIFRTDSISPLFFYKKRNFGGKRFEPIKNWKSDNYIILVDNFPHFELNHIQDKKITFEFSENALDTKYLIDCTNGVYLYPKTIYFTQNNFNLFFENEKDLQHFTGKTHEKYTKTILKYIQNYKILDQTTKRNTFEINHAYLANATYFQDQEKEINRDKIFNILKGTLLGLTCGYLLDQSKSSQEIRAQKEIQNLINKFAVLKNSVNNSKERNKNKFAVFKSISNLEEIFKSISKTVSNYELIQNYLKEQGNASQAEINTFTKVLIKEKDLLDSCLNIISKKSTDGSLQFYVLKDTVNNFVLSKDISLDNIFKNALEIIENSIENSIKSKRVDIDFNSLCGSMKFSDYKFSFTDHILSIKNQESLNILNNILAKFLEVNHLLTSQEVSNDYLAGVINYLGWGKSPLYKHFTQHSSFNIATDTGTNISKNFSAFALKPQTFSELDQLLDLHNIDNRWIAYTFFGCFNGYANLTRVFTSILLDNPNYQDLISDIDDYCLKILPQIDTNKVFEPVEIKIELPTSNHIDLFNRESKKSKPFSKSKNFITPKPKYNQFQNHTIKLDYSQLQKELEQGINETSKTAQNHRHIILKSAPLITRNNLDLFEKKICSLKGIGKGTYHKIIKYLTSYK